MPTHPPPAPTPAPAWPPCLSAGRGGLLLAVSVVPNAAKTEAVGWHGGALRLRLAAPPVDGAANEALLRWLAQALGLRRNAFELVRGASSRSKQVRIDAPAQHVALWLHGLGLPA